MISDWTRWMHASVAAYLRTVATTAGIPSLAEGLEERTTAFEEAQDRVEIRFNGPYTRRYSGLTEAKMSVNVLLTSNFGNKKKNAFSLDNALGQFHSAMDAGIPLFKMGAPTDDLAQLGCLQVISDVKVFHFGQLDPKDRIRQGMVTASYLYHFNN
jgi:hypothetical protein